MSKMPTIFIPHGGGPCFFMDWNPADAWKNMESFLKSVPDTVSERPKAILVISGHWDEAVVTVQSNLSPSLIYDYSGFPEHTYALEYKAPGSPALASRVVDLLSDAGIAVQTDAERGFDHGAFIPLKVAFPDADIPVVQLSMRSDMDAVAHIAIGKALQPLRDEGVLIIGSGMTYHNLPRMMRVRGQADERANGSEFDNWLTATVSDADPEKRNAMLVDWENAPMARDAHPEEDHLIPLHVVAGAAGDDIGQRTFDDVVLGSVQSAYRFG